MNGGISRNEIRSIKNFINKDTKETYKVIGGGDTILTPQNYVYKFITKNK